MLNYRKDGTEFWVEINIVPIADELGQTTHYVSIQREITERKQTEQKLRRTSGELTTIFESITDAFFSLDREWRFTYMNSEAERILERERETLLGKSVWEEFPEAVGLKFYEEYNKAVNEQRTVEFEEIYPSLETWFEVKAYPSKVGLSVYFRNINRRKRMERELRKSEERLRAVLVQYGSDIITILEADGTIRYESPALEKVMGYRPEQRVGESVFEYLHPDDLGKAKRRFAGFLNNQESSALIECRFRHADGSWRYLEATASNLLDDPDVRGIVVNTRDVSGRRKMEKEIRESEERYRSLVELSPDAITVYSEGEIVYANTAGAELFGASGSEELIGRRALDLVHPDYRETVKSRVKHVLETGEPAPLLEEKYLRLDGSVLEVEVAGSSIHYLGKPAI